MKTNGTSIEVYARPVGYLQWVCPNCHEIFGAQQIPWRKARVVCTGCLRVYRLGLGFNLNAFNAAVPPFNAQLAEKSTTGTVNTYNSLPTHPAIARMRGRLDWACPKCNVVQSGQIGRDLMDINCLSCGAPFYLYVILYRSAQGVPTKTPLDWVMPAANSYEYSKNPLNTLAIAQTGEK